MKKINLWSVVALFSLLVATSCGNDEPEDPTIPNEEEVITTLNFTLTPNDGGTPVVLSFQDLDGDGGDEPVISEGTLEANMTYVGSVELLNELESPAEDITEEVKKEAEDHQFFFQTSMSGVSVAYDDMDADGNPIGIASELTTADADSGTITVILRHEPNKFAEGVSEGDITEAGGETDIEVTYNVVIQ